MSRKLASIQKIWKIEPIEGADRIEIAHVLGWQCVVSKGQFQEGDDAVYFEIDSFLPVRPEFEFLRKSCYKKSDFMGEGFRLRTQKFLGNVSQGLLMPISAFPELATDFLGEPTAYAIGDDVTERLGVKKWEVEEMATTGGTVIGVLPKDVPHTDETRCFTKDVKIITNEGLMRIGDIVNNRKTCKVLTYNEETKETEWEYVKNYYKRYGVELLCKISFPFRCFENRTNTLVGTQDHKIKTKDGWKEMKDITTEDKVYLPSESYDENVLFALSGMLLGDSSVVIERRKQKDGSIYKKHRVSFSQGEKQLDYLLEKLRVLGADSKVRKIKSGYCDNAVYNASLQIDDTIEKWMIDVFGEKFNKKTINEKYIEYLNPVSFAFWYMDDGTLKYPVGQRSQIEISSNAYSKEENILLISKLNEYEIDARLRTTTKGEKIYYSIGLTADATEKFQVLVAPYICPSMRYKLEEKYRQIPYVFENFVFKKSIKLFEQPVFMTEIIKPKTKTKKMAFYNIETEKNHNYFASKILVHNCQAEPDLIQAFAGLEYYISTKMDGSSHSISIDDDGFHVCGHNYEYKDDGTSSFYEFVKARGYKEIMETTMGMCTYHGEDIKTLTIQGEFCAPGIQKNRLRLQKPEWYVFTIRVNGKRIGLRDMENICHAVDMPTVPIEEVGTDLPSKYPTVEALLARADGEYPNGGKKEGIVIRPTEPVFCPLISASLSMKVVNNKYLLKNGE